MAQAADLEQAAAEFPADFARTATRTLGPADFGAREAPPAAGAAGAEGGRTDALLDRQRLGLGYSVDAAVMAAKLRAQRARLVYVRFLPQLLNYPPALDQGLEQSARRCIRNTP